MDPDSPDRRSLLRTIGVGGAVGMFGGVGYATWANNRITLSSALDSEIFQQNTVQGGEFGIETAWLYSYGGDVTSRPTGQSRSTFPQQFGDAQRTRVSFSDMEPGTAGHVALALKPKSGPATIDCWGISNGSQELADAISLDCWEQTDWRGQFEEGTKHSTLSGPISGFPTPRSPARISTCVAPSNARILSFVFSLPSLSHEKVSPSLGGEALEFELNVTAKPCHKTTQ